MHLYRCALNTVQPNSKNIADIYVYILMEQAKTMCNRLIEFPFVPKFERVLYARKKKQSRQRGKGSPYTQTNKKKHQRAHNIKLHIFAFCRDRFRAIYYEMRVNYLSISANLSELHRQYRAIRMNRRVHTVPIQHFQ